MNREQLAELEWHQNVTNLMRRRPTHECEDNADTQERKPSSNYAFWLHNGIKALKKTYSMLEAKSAVCVQHSIDSRNSAIHNAYRTLLRPSSLSEPRDSSLNVVKRNRNNFVTRTEMSCENGRPARPHRNANERPKRHVSETRTGKTAPPTEDRCRCNDPTQRCVVVKIYRVNDPSAGSPTETLLRLLLPLSDKVHKTFQISSGKPGKDSVQIIHRITQSVGATGGVYKGQGRNQHKLMTCAY